MAQRRCGFCAGPALVGRTRLTLERPDGLNSLNLWLCPACRLRVTAMILPLSHRNATRIGLAKAVAAGTRIGRPPALSPEMVLRAQVMLLDGVTATQAAKDLGVSRDTLYAHLPGGRKRL